MLPAGRHGEIIRQVHRLFPGTSGIDRDDRLMDSTLVEVPVKQAMLSCAEQTVVPDDHGKFPGTGLPPVREPGEIGVIVTNEGSDTARQADCAGTESRLS